MFYILSHPLPHRSPRPGFGQDRANDLGKDHLYLTTQGKHAAFNFNGMACQPTTDCSTNLKIVNFCPAFRGDKRGRRPLAAAPKAGRIT
jgi:hypothetical protein